MNDDLWMMAHPDKWPHSFKLPLTRKQEPGYGYLLQPSMEVPCPPPEPVVYIGNIFNRHDPDGDSIAYDSLDAIVEDGWHVD